MLREKAKRIYNHEQSRRNVNERIEFEEALCTVLGIKANKILWNGEFAIIDDLTFKAYGQTRQGLSPRVHVFVGNNWHEIKNLEELGKVLVEHEKKKTISIFSFLRKL